MAPTIRASSVGVEPSGGGNAATATKPTGLAVGDYMLALHFCDADGTVASMTAPSGFSLLVSVTADAANNIPGVAVWAKVATSTETAATNFTFNDITASGSGVVLMAITTGTYNTTTPVTFGSLTTQPRPPGSTLQTAPSMTGVNGTLLLGMFVTDANATAESYPSAGPTGMTLVNQGQDGTLYAMGGVYSQALSADGATGAKSVTPTGATTNNGWAAFLAMVNAPAATGPSVATRSGGFLSIL